MPRLTRDARLESREARSKLKKRRPPYWRSVHQGLAIGYRKGEKGGVWMVRKLVGDDKYSFQSIGNADDYQDANGIDVLSYQQAHRKALDESNRKTPGGPYTVDDAARDYMEWAKAHTKSAGATESTINAHILTHFKGRQVDSLTTAELDRWKNKLVTAPIHRRGKLVEADSDPETTRKRKSSANRILTTFKAMLNKAWENKRVQDKSEWERVKPFEGVDEARKIFLQPDQCKRLINVCQGSFREYVQALLYTGARPGKELEFIRAGDFDRKAGTVRIPDGKTGAREIFLTDEGLKFFERLSLNKKPDDFLLVKEDGGQWGKNHHAKPMKAAVAAAALPKGTNAYALRHTYISMALLNGVNIKLVADNCGTSVRMIEKHYAKFLNQDRRRLFNKALPSFGFKDDGKVRAIR